MGFIFQTYNLLPVLSAVENVELPLVVSGMSPEGGARARDGRPRSGQPRRPRPHRPSQLRGGQRQRVTIARALVNDPAIVWADEPTGALDSETADDIMSLMEELNAENQQTFVIVTHDACDRRPLPPHRPYERRSDHRRGAAAVTMLFGHPDDTLMFIVSWRSSRLHGSW